MSQIAQRRFNDAFKLYLDLFYHSSLTEPQAFQAAFHTLVVK